MLPGEFPHDIVHDSVLRECCCHLFQIENMAEDRVQVRHRLDINCQRVCLELLVESTFSSTHEVLPLEFPESTP